MSELRDLRDALIRADEPGEDKAFKEKAFVEKVCEILGAADVAEDLVPCTWRGKGSAGRLLGVDAAATQTQDGSATLLLAVFYGDPGDPGTISQTELVKHASRLANFTEEALGGGLTEKLPPDSPEEDLRATLAERRSTLTKIRLLVVTDLRLSERVRELPGEVRAGVSCEFHIWDIARLSELAGKGHEPLEIDLHSDFNSPGIACLPVDQKAAEYHSYLCVVPADLLADLYEKFGARLLETNVRGFLSERGKVNRGIRSTIQNHPRMFFAYNNGLTATASGVDVSEDGSRIVRISDLQIVNGGQTTASLFWARKKHRSQLGEVNVQMKLSVIPESIADRFDEIVSRISACANSQNKVSDADLFANHPFHREMEKISRRAGMAPKGGGSNQTYWYYERARAQHDNERRALSRAEQERFDRRYPKSQVVTKTDFAKYWSCWEQLPQFVSRGAQKNFQKVASMITVRWEKNPDIFNEVFYKRVIGIAYVYKALENRIQKEPWYDGYRINIIAFTLSVLFRAIEMEGMRLNLLAIWTAQGIDEAAELQLIDIARTVYDALRNHSERSTRPQWGNLGQWFKEERCWDCAADVRIEVPHALMALLIPSAQYHSQGLAGTKGKQVDNGIDAQMDVVKLHTEGFWQRLLEWNQEDPILSDLELEAVVRMARSSGNNVPRDRESILLVNAKKHAESEGFV
jgi:hypothetical protein